MSTTAIPVSPRWLDLREAADANARSRELVERLRPQLPPAGLVIHDLACGTGSMGRWLGPLLPEPQRWVLHDRDADLLRIAAASGDVEVRESDITQLDAEDLAGTSLITGSALLDLMTVDELEGLVDLCTRVGCPVLLALSVVGRVGLTPVDRLDARIAAAFDAHQRRVTARGRLLGPDAVATAADEFRRRGAEVLVRPSPWRLGAADSALAAEWLTGWLDAAFEQDPALAADAAGYAAQRLAQARAGRLAVTVGHADLLVVP
jgi:trans-aconitate methyltransferase